MNKEVGKCGNRKILRFEVCICLSITLLVIGGLIWLFHGMKTHEDYDALDQKTTTTELASDDVVAKE